MSVTNCTLKGNSGRSYGGATPTHALLADSPALNAGSNALAVDRDGNALTTDQRGAGIPRIVGASVDIGAFELDDSNSPPSPTPTPNTAPNAANDTYGVNEDTALNTLAPSVLGNNTDAQNDALTAIVQTSLAHAAAFTLNANGSFSSRRTRTLTARIRSPTPPSTAT